MIIDARDFSQIVEVIQIYKGGPAFVLQWVRNNPRRLQYTTDGRRVFVRYRRKGDKVKVVWRTRYPMEFEETL